MKRLIVAGGGNEIDSRPLDELFLKLVEGNRVLYIPIARPAEQYEKCYDWFSRTFRALDFTNFEMWTELSGKNYGDLDQFGAIYIGGGNTYKLLYILKETGFIRLLEDFMSSGRVIYGGSAGAIILGKSIDTAQFGGDPDENTVNLKDLSALNAVGGYSINCHYRKAQDNILMTFSKQNQLPIIAISEKSGLFVEGKNITVIGTDPAFVFENGKKTVVEIGRNIPLPDAPVTIDSSDRERKE